MANSYQMAINRLKDRRAENPYLQTAKSQAGMLAPQFGDLQRNLETSLRSTGSAGAKLQATQEVGQQYEQAIGGIYDRMDASQRARVDQINQQIDEIEFRKDIAEEEKKKQKKALSDQKNKMLWTAIGTGAGALIGGPAGAKIGGGLAGGITSATGYTPDAAGMFEGLTNVVSGINDVSILKQDKEISAGLQEFLKGTKDLDSAASEVMLGKMLAFQNDPKGMINFLQNWREYLSKDSLEGLYGEAV